jgi:hypothetical protein
MAWILHYFLPDLYCTEGFRELRVLYLRLDQVMKNDSGMFGLVVGCVVALVAFAFIFSGGEFGGKKVIEGDQDLPPVETTNN